MVSITQDMMGGEWQQATRHVRIHTAGWLGGRTITVALHELEKASERADQNPHRPYLESLKQKLNRLDREVQLYEHHVNEFRRQVGEYIAAVHIAIENGHYEPLPTEARVDGLVDEDLLDRMGALYGIPKPRRRR